MRLIDDRPDVDVVVIDWSDEPTPCRWPKCSTSAVWWTECSCGFLFAACEAHRTAADKRRNPRTGTALCNQCGERMPAPIVWHPLR
jgi:hypothetical protein